MAKKKYTTNPHQLDLLEKYFPVDREKKLVTIKIYYEKATDMLDFSVGELHKEMLTNEVLEKITEITDKIPVDYKVDVLFIITDYCDYNPDALLEKLNDLIEINNYQIIHEKKRNFILASVLALVGFILLFLLSIEKKYNWIGEGLAKTVLEEMFDITSWVFIWQSVTVLFLSPSDLVKIGVKFITKIHTISLCGKDEQVLTSENQEDIFENFEVESRVSGFRKTSLLATSTILLGLGIYRVGETIVTFADNLQAGGTEFMYSNLIFGILVDSFVLLTGIYGILYYRGDLRMRKPLRVFAIIMLVTIAISLFSCFYIGFYDQAFTSVVILIVEILFVYGALEHSQKKKKKTNKEE